MSQYVVSQHDESEKQDLRLVSISSKALTSRKSTSPLGGSGVNVSHGSWSYLPRITVYQLLGLLVLLPNFGVLVHTIYTRKFDRKPSACITACAANVSLSILIRQDHIVDFLFWFFGLLPHSAPFWLRCRIAKLYHLGGIHSSSGLAAAVWFLLFNVGFISRILKDSLNHRANGFVPHVLMMALTVFMDILFFQITFLSIPAIRRRFHNVWEYTHRVGGWLLLKCFWCHLFLYEIKMLLPTSNQPLSRLLAQNPALYLVAFTTISVVLPWVRLRRVSVGAELLSPHAVRLHFDYNTLGACKTPRFSCRPLSEWHAFASIPNEFATGFSCVVSRAGDWTATIIDNPPTHLWTKGRPARGTLYMAKLFSTVLCVATGSGIAPVLGLFTMAGPRYRMFWSARSPERTFGSDILRRVYSADPLAVIKDTELTGRPNLVEEAMCIYASGDIEAIFVISNADVTRSTVYALESRGVPAFGPIFDS